MAQTWVRDLFPNAQWDPNTRRIGLPNGLWLGNGQYSMQGDKAFVDPSSLIGLYMGQKPMQLDQNNFANFSKMAEGLYKPLFDARQKSMDAQYGQSKMNLEKQETNSLKRLKSSAETRGTYSSPYMDYQQRELSSEYAPQYQQLETNKNAGLGELQGQYMTNVANSAFNLFNAESTKQENSKNALMEYLAGIITNKTKAEQQAFDNKITTADQTGILDGKPTLGMMNAQTNRINANKSGSGGSSYDPLGIADMSVGERADYFQNRYVESGLGRYQKNLEAVNKQGKHLQHPLYYTINSMLRDKEFGAEARKNGVNIQKAIDDFLRETKGWTAEQYFNSQTGKKLLPTYLSLGKSIPEWAKPAKGGNSKMTPAQAAEAAKKKAAEQAANKKQADQNKSWFEKFGKW